MHKFGDRVAFIVAAIVYALFLGLPVAVAQIGSGVGVSPTMEPFARLDQTSTFNASPRLANTVELQGVLSGGSAAWLIGVDTDDEIYVGGSSAGPVLNLLGTSITANAIDMTPQEGSFTVTWDTGCANDPQSTGYYVAVGNLVTLHVTDPPTCSADGSTYAASGGTLPAAIRPARQQTVGMVGYVDNTGGNEGVGAVVLGTAGDMSLCKKLQDAGGTVVGFSSCDLTLWSGARNAESFTVSYVLH